MMEDTITSDDILGKEALDPEADILGVVVKLHIKTQEKTITGITIDQGFMKPDLFVGLEYVKKFGIDAVLLNRIPTEKFKGLRMITEQGNAIGIVKDVIKKKQKVKQLVVQTDRISLSRKEFRIAYKDIKEIGSSVVLKKNFKMKD